MGIKPTTASCTVARFCSCTPTSCFCWQDKMATLISLYTHYLIFRRRKISVLRQGFLYLLFYMHDVYSVKVKKTYFIRIEDSNATVPFSLFIFFFTKLRVFIQPYFCYFVLVSNKRLKLLD